MTGTQRIVPGTIISRLIIAEKSCLAPQKGCQALEARVGACARARLPFGEEGALGTLPPFRDGTDSPRYGLTPARAVGRFELR